MNTPRGFTLIELLVTIAIIGLLSAVILASLTNSRAKSRDAARVVSLREMIKAISLADKDISPAFVGCTGAHVDASTCTGPVPINFTSYKDPSTPGTPCTAGSTGTCQFSVSTVTGGGAASTQNYQICTWLEVGSGVIPAGLVKITSSNNSIVAGCI